VLGIHRVKPLRGGAHQRPAVGRAFGDDFGPHRYTGGMPRRKVDNPRNVKNRFREGGVQRDLSSSLYSERRDARCKVYRNLDELISIRLCIRPLRVSGRGYRQQRRLEQGIGLDRQIGCDIVLSERKLKDLKAGPRCKRYLTRTAPPGNGECFISVPWRGVTEVIVGDAVFDNIPDAGAHRVERDQPRMLVFCNVPISVDLPI
jgi:hypothetical protein